MSKLVSVIFDDQCPGESQFGEPSPCGNGVAIGTLEGFDRTGQPLVCFPGAGVPVPARSCLNLSDSDVTSQVVLMFESNGRLPILIGKLRCPALLESARPSCEALVDGEKVTIAAGREIVLRCGEASITLTRAGKVIIRGAAVVSRSSGVNRIKGASVQIN